MPTLQPICVRIQDQKGQNLMEEPRSKRNCTNFTQVHSAVKYRVMAGEDLNNLKHCIVL